MDSSEKEKQRQRQQEWNKYTTWYYNHEYWKEDNSSAQNDRYQYNDPDHSKRFGFLTNLITENFEFQTFLDVGCGMGHIVRNLNQKGYKGKGVDVSKDALNTFLSDMVKQQTVFFGAAEQLPFKENAFDAIICFDVMEHLPLFDVDKAVSELVRVAGKSLILTINLDNPYEYHPSMLTREEWEQKFLSTGKVTQLTELQNKVEQECKKQHPEYDFFIFQK